MVKSPIQANNKACSGKKRGKREDISGIEKLSALCKHSAKTVDQIYNPVDAVNRFINLALQSLDENSQGRQFLIESKKGLRTVSGLLKRLNNSVKKMEGEIKEAYPFHAQNTRTDS